MASPERIPLKSNLHWRLENASDRTLERMTPTIKAVLAVENFTSQTLADFGLNQPDIFRISSEHITLGDQMNPEHAKKLELVAQYIHINQVIGTTLSLERAMTEMNLPERTFAYQLGTGFPLPAEDENFVLKGFIPLGQKSLLRQVPKPGVAGHTEDSGMYLYEIIADNGQEATLVALKGRVHGYEVVNSPRPHLTLAVLPRILKGIGVESVLATFASGFDTVTDDNSPSPFHVGDYGYVIVNSDLSGLSARTHPAVGDQTIIGPVFGGPFRSTPDRTSPDGLIATFEQGVELTYPEQKFENEPIPQRHGALLYDTNDTPDFENAAGWMRARLEGRNIINTPGVISPETRNIIRSPNIAIAHGMATASELAAYYQAPTFGNIVESLYNRVLPTLAIVGCTDKVDPRVGGQSRRTTHDNVQKAGERSARLIAPVLSNYFKQLAGQTPITL